MRSIQTDGSRALLSGSSVEGQTYARHLANQNIQDIDILLYCGSVGSEKNLIQTTVPGFVRIKFDDEITASGTTQFIGQEDANGIRCINGFKLKEEHCTNTAETSIGAPLAYVTRSGHTPADSSGAAATQQLDYRTINICEQFREALVKTVNQRDQFNFNTLKTNYERFSRDVDDAITQYALPSYQTPANAQMFEEENINGQTFRDLFTLAGPAFDYTLPQVSRVRIQALLDFYDRYKHVGNPNTITDMADYFKSCAPVDADLVPALQLKFWPSDIQAFFQRIEISRPRLYELIRSKTSMHVIPKWSTKTPRCDRELEFRYSFSAVELLLAQERSHNEQILNGIARSIYYKFLKNQRSSNQSVLPSYFIKTTVLWMCETLELNNDTTKTLAEKWLKYATDLLNTRHCPHYFIQNLDILEPYSEESLKKARQILLAVQIDDVHEIQMFTATGQEFYRNKYIRNVAYFLSNLRTLNVINALNDYRQLKHNWLCPSSNSYNDDDEVGVTAALTILNTLRALDGDKENWKRFREIFLECTATVPPIWGETINTDSVVGFAEALFSIGIILTLINDNISSTDMLPTQSAVCHMDDFQNFQNVIHQYLNPTTLYASIQSTYSYLYNQSISAFERRTLTDHHPYGPQMIHGGANLDRGFYRLLIDLSQNAPTENLTLRECYQRQQINEMDEDQLVAYVTQLSLDDAKQ